jgi:hypothetical protein
MPDRWPYCHRCADDLGWWWGLHVWLPQWAVDRLCDWLWLR